MLLETFYEDREKKTAYRITQINSNALRPIDGISCQCFLVCLDCTKYNEINTYFCRSKNL